MYSKKLFYSNKLGSICIITLTAIYIINILLLTVGFFTPYWLREVTYFRGYLLVNNLNVVYHDVTFDTVGLISGEYRFSYPRKFTPEEIYSIVYVYYQNYIGVELNDNRAGLERDMKRTFALALMTLCILYLNLLMTLAAIIFKLYENRIYLSFWSITFGTLYPIGAISILSGTIMLEVQYGSEVGFSTILGTICGGLMLVFYICLRLYNHQYAKYLIELQNTDSAGKVGWHTARIDQQGGKKIKNM